MDEAKLKRELDELSDLSQNLLNILLSQEDGDYNSLLYQYKQKRAELLLEVNKDSKIPKIADPILRRELKFFIKEGDVLISVAKKSKHEAVRNFGKVLEGQFKPEFDPKRLDDLEIDLFYSWFSPSDYVFGLIETGTIVIKHIDLPEKLQRLIMELRQCLIFQNYLAAGIMLRTITEVGINDILKKEFNDYTFETLEGKLIFLEGRSAFKMPAAILNAFRKQMNEFVHGERLINSKYIRGHVDVVLESLEKMYEEVSC